MTYGNALRQRFAAIARDAQRATRHARGGRVRVERPTNVVRVMNTGEPGVVRHASSVQHVAIPQAKQTEPPSR
jgi:hypothetical protein